MSLVLGAVGGNIGEVIVTIPFRRLDLFAPPGHDTANK
jgi:hypothetical protein